MGTRNIDLMLSRPGIFVVVGDGHVAFCEVEDGRCWQLTLTDYARDGELRPGGWILDSIIAIHGPFQRTPAARETESA